MQPDGRAVIGTSEFYGTDPAAQEAAYRAAALGGRGSELAARRCEWCARRRPLGKFWQPVVKRYIWICRQCADCC